MWTERLSTWMISLHRGRKSGHESLGNAVKWYRFARRLRCDCAADSQRTDREQSGAVSAADECQSSAAHGNGNVYGIGLEKSSEYPSNGVYVCVRVGVCASGCLG